MIGRYAVATAAILIVSVQANAKARLDLIANPEQVSRMESGLEVIDSDKGLSSVRIFESEERVKKRGTMTILAFNAGEKPFNLGSENVSIETETGEPVAVIPFERLQKELKNKQMWAAIATGMAAASNSMAASNAGYSNGYVTAYGQNGYSSATYNSYNAGAAYQAQAIANIQNQQSFDRLAYASAAAKESLGVNMRTSTIDPGASFGGQIVYELPKNLRNSKVPIPVKIRVKIGEEEHLISAMLVPDK
jgi:hypothetical protein